MNNLRDFSVEKANPSRCIRKVPDYTGFHFFQCTRRRADGLYCKQHAKQQRTMDEHKAQQAKKDGKR